MRRRWPLRLRIAVATALAVTVAVAGMAVAGYAIVAHELDRSLNLGLTREVARLVRLEQASPGAWSPAGPCVFLAAPACVQKVDVSGRVEGDSALPVDERTTAVAAGRSGAFFSDIVLEGFPVRMLTAPLATGTAVEVAVRSDRVDESLRRISLALLAAGAAGVVLAAVAGFAVARAGLAPVAALTSTAERVARTRDPQEHLDVRGDDEIARLATAFNTMLGELQQALGALRESLTAQRQLVADASHELRTPLTGLRTNIDLLTRADRLSPGQRAATIEALRAQAVELTGLVTDLIDLARGDEAPAEETEDVRLDELVERCAAVARRHHPGITFETDLEPTVLDGVPRTLARAVTNLLDNAAKFSPARGTVQVRLHGGELVVQDRGPGIAAAELDRVFDRFYRSAAARGLPGSGLGLAIVHQVATAHGATATAESPPGGGALFRLRFPAT
ncbi:HAMP domain-containing histidine kinase [Saccharopolyspora indica]|uniref:HAMP domain-containing sensor histidine kinase n=1 Tax=Saccharopolyspora indica TaxID=1229659 RepID=UPI0022EA8A81|nr:HAMP domain-containing sensor histidine kinase [Saccharopolyspora indica]MDA3649331.1 HAMP domain-containing sensor histidine kinase [Saccharopolyspora indica]